jgi:hypothetical protein
MNQHITSGPGIGECSGPVRSATIEDRLDMAKELARRLAVIADRLALTANRVQVMPPEKEAQHVMAEAVDLMGQFGGALDFAHTQASRLEYIASRLDGMLFHNENRISPSEMARVNANSPTLGAYGRSGGGR